MEMGGKQIPAHMRKDFQQPEPERESQDTQQTLPSPASGFRVAHPPDHSQVTPEIPSCLNSPKPVGPTVQNLTLTHLANCCLATYSIHFKGLKNDYEPIF